MFDVARVLAAAISAQHPELFALPDTSRAGPTRSDPMPVVSLLTLFAAAAAVALLGRRRVLG